MYSRLTTTRKPLERTESKAACDAALMNLRQSIEHSGAIVTVGHLPIVLGDSTQLSQLFQNLIGNAVKYCKGHKPQIEISSCAESEHWVFSVDDNGIGIEPQYFERIFQMFQRLHTRQHYSGTGIGLAICRKIVERHGGKIWLESQVGSGSKFIFTIPKGQSE